MLPLCSAPIIALLVAGEDCSLFLVGTWRCCSLLEHVYLLGYHNISYLMNASIYLTRGGRLGRMPGVFCHSCRPSFRHIGVMFPDFSFLTRLGYNGNPWIVRLGEITSTPPSTGAGVREYRHNLYNGCFSKVEVDGFWRFLGYVLKDGYSWM